VPWSPATFNRDSTTTVRELLDGSPAGGPATEITQALLDGYDDATSD
jgi:hypothetical protein